MTSPNKGAGSDSSRYDARRRKTKGIHGVARPTTCIGCGGELPAGLYLYCTSECAEESRRQIRARRRDSR